MLVPGAPGTGKSTVLIEAAVRRVEANAVDPERILILAPGRLAADTLRDRFTATAEPEPEHHPGPHLGVLRLRSDPPRQG